MHTERILDLHMAVPLVLFETMPRSWPGNGYLSTRTKLGTAVFISERRLLTSWTLVRQSVGPYLRLINPDSSHPERRATIIDFSPGSNLALLELTSKSADCETYLPLASHRPDKNFAVTIFGYTRESNGRWALNSERTAAAGQVMHCSCHNWRCPYKRNPYGWLRLFPKQTVSPGWSGGPIVNDADEIISLTSEMIVDKDNHPRRYLGTNLESMRHLSWFRN